MEMSEELVLRIFIKNKMDSITKNFYKLDKQNLEKVLDILSKIDDGIKEYNL